MLKREFYRLFKVVWHWAFTEFNILSDWCKAELQPLDSDIILSQLKPSKWPLTSASGSSSSTVYFASNIHKVHQLVECVISENLSCNAVKLQDLLKKLTAKNSILQAQVLRLKNAVNVKKKRRKKEKPLM